MEYLPLKKVTLINKFKQISAKKLHKLANDDGNVYLLPSSKDYNLFTTKEKANKNLCIGNVITLGKARHPNIKKCQGYFVSSNNIIIQSYDENKLLFRYLYYLIDKNKFSFYITTSTYPKFDIKIFNDLLIPLPPLEIQNEIVKILDKFNDLCNDLTKGIPAEIELRKKQYEYYRDKLLTFDELKV